MALLISVQSYAFDFMVDNIYYNKLSSNEVEVTYKAKSHNNYKTYIGNIVVPETVIYEENTYKVTAVGDKAFCMCNHLTSVTLPSSIKSIGNYAFDGCIGLKDINIPSNVNKIGYGAFSACQSLTSIDIPEGVTKIDTGLFCFCVNIKSIKLPSTITSIEQLAFSNCTSLTHINLPQGLISIGHSAFSECSAIKDITIPSSVTTIEDAAFNKTGIVSVTIPSSVTTLHPNAFKDCPNLKSVILPDKNNKGEINGHEWVDLGLPSGTKWATCNVGASSPEECGKYYAWGEIKHKMIYSGQKSEAYGKHRGDISGDAKYDVARANWGGSWRMPTIDELYELVKYCYWESATINGQNGVKIISKTNYHYIFLPCAGSRIGASAAGLYSKGLYWSSTIHKVSPVRAEYLYFHSGGSSGTSDDYLGTGHTIRPVTD